MSSSDGSAQRRTRLSPAKRAFLQKRLQGKLRHPADDWAIPPLADRTIIPLSSAQQRVWFAYQWDPEAAIYNRPAAWRLKGELDLPALQKSLAEIVQRHEALRAVVAMAGDKPVQRVCPPFAPSLPLEDLSSLPPDKRLAAAQRSMVSISRRPFDLEASPMLRLRLFRLGPTEHVLLFVTHHIVFDGWSETLFINELSILYESFVTGETVHHPEPAIQYADYAHWQQGQAWDAAVAYWKRKLAGPLPVLDLPSDHPRPAVQTYDGTVESLHLPRELIGRLTELGREEEATLFMTLLAAFKVLLHRCSGQADLIVGSPVAGRDRLETQHVIGVLANTLALRSDLSGRPTFRQALRRVRRTCLEAYAHQELPFEILIRELGGERDLHSTDPDAVH